MLKLADRPVAATITVEAGGQRRAIARSLVATGPRVAPSRGIARGTLVTEARRAGLAPVRLRRALEVTGTRSLAAILIRFQNDPVAPPFTVDAVRQAIFTGPGSVNAFYRENSFGVLGFAPKNVPAGDVFGWYTVPTTAANECDVDTWGALGRTAANAAGVNLSGYDHIVYIWPPGHCDGTSQATLPSTDPARNRGFVAEAWMDGDISLTALGHELGHNLGLSHGWALSCRDGANVRIPVGGTCTAGEYFDPFTVMGSQDPVANDDFSFHVNAAQKAQLGWIPDSRRQLIDQAGTYPLAASETVSTTAQELRFRRCGAAGSTPTTYSVEYRRPSGFDAIAAGLSGTVTPALYVRLVPNTETFGSSATPVNPRTLLLDANPSTPTYIDAGVAAGQRFADPQTGFSLTPSGLGGDTASVAVAFDADTTTPPVPDGPRVQLPGAAALPPIALSELATRPVRQVSVSWNSVTDCGFPAFGYRLLRAGVEVGATSGSTLNDPGSGTLPPGSAVSYSVRSADGAGNLSDPSAAQTVSVPDLVAPTVPAGLHVSLTGAVPTIAWDASTDTASIRYALYRDGRQVAITSDRSYRDQALTVGAKPSYQVLALDLDNNLSAASAPVVATLPPGVTPAPTKPLRVGRFTLSAPAAVLVQIRRPGTKRVLAAIRIAGRAGVNTFVLPAKSRGRVPIPKGSYLVTVLVTGGRGRLTSQARFPLVR